MLESQMPDGGKPSVAVATKREGQRAKHVSAAGRRGASARRRPLGPGGRSRLVWNDVNVEVRGECYELFYERFAAEEGLTDAAVLARAPHDDLRNTRQARELGDLKRRRRRHRRFPYVLRAARLGRYWLQAWRAHHRSGLRARALYEQGDELAAKRFRMRAAARTMRGWSAARETQTKIRSLV